MKHRFGGDWWVRATDKAGWAYTRTPNADVEASRRALLRGVARCEAWKARALLRAKVIVDTVNGCRKEGV